jgi:hypothetical protein
MIESLQQQIEGSKLWAQYWLAMATTGATTRRRVFQGLSERELTEEELIDDAMNTAKSHLHRVQQLSDMRLGRLRKEVPELEEMEEIFRADQSG